MKCLTSDCCKELINVFLMQPRLRSHVLGVGSQGRRKRRFFESLNALEDLDAQSVHISLNGVHLSFFIFPHFWHVFKACDASRGILPKKVKND